jgi:hypothetical protein
METSYWVIEAILIIAIVAYIILRLFGKLERKK